ncbi:glycoside hydrolase family 2 protein [Streptomyces aculeolatus]
MNISPTTAALPSHTVLDGNWTLRSVEGPVPEDIAGHLRNGIPATVPGVVHMDLLTAGLIPDPFDADQESAVAWIGRTDWEYTRTFEWSSNTHERHDLVAEGLDTVATVWVNGIEVLRAANHHRSYRADLRGILHEGRNEIRIGFSAAVSYAEQQAARLGPRPHANTHPFNAIRKPAYSFGWDWGPELVTAGVWRSIGIESWSVARISALRPLASYSPEAGAALDVHADIEPADADVQLAIRVRVVDTAGTVDAAAAASVTGHRGFLTLGVPGASAWWPRGYGDQPLHPMTVELVTSSGTVLDRRTHRIGFRTVVLDTAVDETGNRFRFIVNGREVYIRGANWIPAHSYLPRVTGSDLDRALKDAVDANMNLIRVWGGGIYESEDFYSRCDELGLLVWQDFLLACAAYAEEEPLSEELEAEAREAVTRLSRHPSLALFCGGNENLWGYASWGWRGQLRGATWGDGYYRDLFPRIVTELAPGTPYCPGSPTSIDPYLHPNDPANGAMHIWDVWNTRDYTAYRTHSPRFVSEFGFQGPPAFSTLRSVVHDEPGSPYGPQILVHQKAEDGNLKLERGLGEHLPFPADFTDWHWATQLNQARAIRFGIEHFRSLSPLNTGAIVWQLNDCWPVISWSAVDARGIRKPLWHALRAAYAERLATVQPRADGHALVLHNDHDAAWRTTGRAVRQTLDGTELKAVDFTADVDARGAATIALDDTLFTPEAPTEELVVIHLGTGERALWYFTEDTTLALRPEPYVVSTRPTAEGHEVVVQAHSLVKDLMLLVDHVDPDASVDSGLITLLPGEEAVLRVRTAAETDPDALLSRPVLRTANDLAVIAAARPVRAGAAR